MLVLLFKLIPNTLCTNINAPTIYNDFSFHYNLIFLLSCFSLLIEHCNHRLHLSLSLSLQPDHQLSTSIQAFQHVDHYRLRSCSSTCRPWLSSTTVPRQTFVRIEFSPRLPSSSTTLCPCQKSWPEYLVNIPRE